MKRITYAGLNIPLLVLVLTLFASCNSDNLIGPGNQLEVTNATDNFQFQVSNLDNVTQTLSYNWSITGDSANVNQASSLAGRSGTLTVRGPNGTMLYQASLQNNGTFHTQRGTSGSWQVEVALNKANGTLNFRLQKAP